MVTYTDLAHAKTLIARALKDDEQGRRKEALKLYLQAAELCINYVCYILFI